MDQTGHSRIRQFLKKYVYMLLILLLGIVLMLLPETNKQTSNDSAGISDIIKAERISLQQQLSDLLSMVEGAGKVNVLLTVIEGEQTIYQVDENTSQVNTVIINDNGRNQTGLIRRVDPPKYQGAIILCQGADHTAIRLAVTEAVSKATGLGYDKISVLKMR